VQHAKTTKTNVYKKRFINDKTRKKWTRDIRTDAKKVQRSNTNVAD